MYQIAQLLEMPGQNVDSPILPVSALRSGNTSRTSREHRSIFANAGRVPGFAAALRRDNTPVAGVSRIHIAQNRSIEGLRNESDGRSRRRTSNASSGSSTQLNDIRDNSVSGKTSLKSRDNSRNQSSRSCESSLRMLRPRSEEIPLEDFHHSRTSSLTSRSSSNVPSRPQTPSRIKYDFVPPHITLPSETTQSQINVLGSVHEIAPVSSEETSFISQED